jgi:hypothetical protein
MKVKTNELTGRALDWAVAKCEGIELNNGLYNRLLVDGHMSLGQNMMERFNPSSEWAQGGPIIERECIELAYRVGVNWTATRVEGSSVCEVTVPYNQRGRAQLIAAMRCYVMSQLGDEVDVPEELK